MIIARRNNRTLLMYAVDIYVEQGDLSRKMSAMRIWLDEHRFEPSTFSCRDTDDGTLVCAPRGASPEKTAMKLATGISL